MTVRGDRSDTSFREAMVALDRAAGDGDWVEAVRIARRLLADGGRDALQPVQVAAAVLQEVGEFGEAIALRQRAVELDHGSAASTAGLAECLFAARRPEEAIAAWDAALALAPDDALILSGKARSLHGLGWVDEATALFRRAHDIDPNEFKALFGLALLSLEAGRFAETVALVQDLSALEPSRSDVRWLAARAAFGTDDMAAAEAHLEAMLQGRLTPAQRAEALLLEGQVLDRLGAASAAFAAATEGKAIQRRLFAERAAGREGEVAKLNRLARWFERADRAAWGPCASLAGPIEGAAAIHVFLVGFPRSGTTLIEQALAGHPAVVTLEEAPTLAEAYAAFLSSDEGCARLARLNGGDADRWRSRYWAQVRAHGVDAAGKVFLDKAPGGTLDLPLVARLFPAAKVLFALRDPRDVVLSCLRHAFQMNAMTYAFTDLGDAAACYDACMSLADVYRGVLAVETMTVRHEALVDDFAAGLAAICRFVGIEVQPSMIDIAATAGRRSIRTPSAAQVRAGLNRRGIGHWYAYAAELAPVRGRLEPWAERFGYAPGAPGGTAA